MLRLERYKTHLSFRSASKIIRSSFHGNFAQSTFQFNTLTLSKSNNETKPCISTHNLLETKNSKFVQLQKNCRSFSTMPTQDKITRQQLASLVGLVRVGDIDSLLHEICSIENLISDQESFDSVLKLTFDELDYNGFYDSMFEYAVALMERDLINSTQVNAIMERMLRSFNIKLTCDFAVVMAKRNMALQDSHILRIVRIFTPDKFENYYEEANESSANLTERKNAVEQLLRIAVAMSEQRMRPRIRLFRLLLEVLRDLIPDSPYRVKIMLEVVTMAEININRSAMKDLLETALDLCRSDPEVQIGILERLKQMSIYREADLIAAYIKIDNFEAAMDELHSAVDRERDIKIFVYVSLIKLLHSHGRLDLCDKLIFQRIRQRKGSYSVWSEIMWLWTSVNESERCQKVILDILGSGFNLNYIHCITVLHKYILSPDLQLSSPHEPSTLPTHDTFELFRTRISVGEVFKHINFDKLLTQLEADGLLANNLLVALCAYKLCLTRYHDKDLIRRIDVLVDKYLDNMVASTNAIIANDTQRLSGYTRLAEIYRPYEPFVNQPGRKEMVKQKSSKVWLHKMVNIHKKKTYEIADLPDYALQCMWLAFLADLMYRTQFALDNVVYDQRFHSSTLSTVYYYRVFKPYEFAQVSDHSDNNYTGTMIDKHFRLRPYFKNLLSPYIGHQNLVLGVYLKSGDISHVVQCFKYMKTLPSYLLPNSETYQALITAYVNLCEKKKGSMQSLHPHSVTTNTHNSTPKAGHDTLPLTVEELELYILDEAEHACARYYTTTSAMALHRKLVELPLMQDRTPEEIQVWDQAHYREMAVMNLAPAKLWFVSQNILLNRIDAQREILHQILNGSSSSEVNISSDTNNSSSSGVDVPPGQIQRKQVEIVIQTIDALIARFLKTLAVQDELSHVVPNDQGGRMAVICLLMHEGQHTSDDRYLQTAFYMISLLAKSNRFNFKSVCRMIYYCGAAKENELEPFVDVMSEFGDAKVEIIPAFSLQGIDFTDVVASWSQVQSSAATSDMLRNRDELMLALWEMIPSPLLRNMTDHNEAISLVRSFLRTGRYQLLLAVVDLYSNSQDVISRSFVADFESLWGVLLYISSSVRNDVDCEDGSDIKTVSFKKFLTTVESCMSIASKHRYFTHPAYLLTLFHMLNAIPHEEIRRLSFAMALRITCDDLTQLMDRNLWNKVREADPEFESNIKAILSIMNDRELEWCPNAPIDVTATATATATAIESTQTPVNPSIFNFSYAQSVKTISTLRARLNELST